MPRHVCLTHPLFLCVAVSCPSQLNYYQLNGRWCETLYSLESPGVSRASGKTAKQKEILMLSKTLLCVDAACRPLLLLLPLIPPLDLFLFVFKRPIISARTAAASRRRIRNATPDKKSISFPRKEVMRWKYGII